MFASVFLEEDQLINLFEDMLIFLNSNNSHHSGDIL
jgi:hypothetical protein